MYSIPFYSKRFDAVINVGLEYFFRPGLSSQYHHSREFHVNIRMFSKLSNICLPIFQIILPLLVSVTSVAEFSGADVICFQISTYLR